MEEDKYENLSNDTDKYINKYDSLTNTREEGNHSYLEVFPEEKTQHNTGDTAHINDSHPTFTDDIYVEIRDCDLSPEKKHTIDKIKEHGSSEDNVYMEVSPVYSVNGEESKTVKRKGCPVWVIVVAIMVTLILSVSVTIGVVLSLQQSTQQGMYIYIYIYKYIWVLRRKVVTLVHALYS